MFKSKPFLFVLSLSFALACFADMPAKQDIEGLWLGTLSAQNTNLRIVFHISRQPDSTLSVTLDSPDQGAKNIPADDATFTDGTLHVGIKRIMGGYDGTLVDSTGKIEGNWSQGGRSFPLSLARTDSVPELARPQEPKPPFPYRAEEVTFVNPQGGDTLAGTLTLPESGAPFTAVVLISGSGPQDRDEALFGHKPFLIIADYLTRRGIAVLRVDDRGVGKSTGTFATATTEDFATDAEVAMAYLQTRKDMNRKKIGLIGHSEGALVADMIAARSKDVAFIVDIAGPGIPGEQLVYQQGDLISKANGMNDADIERNHALREQMFSIVKEEKDSVVAAERLRALLTTPETAKDTANHYVDLQIHQLLSPWMRSFLVYDPRPDLEKIKCPVLAIFGEKDLQVPPQPSSAEVAKALDKGKSHSYEIKILPGLNHLMQTATTGSPGEYVKIEETFSPDALKIIGDWIEARTK
jgi:pimeloyl-ACP methyl ester carboxylesterase